MKNKKGFTLVELLAVIVILALIMGIAVVSIGGVLSSSREKTYRETAASIINGVRQQLYVENAVPTANTSYTYTSGILEKGGTTSPYNSNYNYTSSISDCDATNKVGTSLCKMTTYKTDTDCTASTASFVSAEVSGGAVTYRICLSDGSHWVYATDTQLLNNDTAAAIYPTPAA